MQNNKSDLLTVLKSCRQSFIVIGIFSCCINILMLVPSIYMLQVYDRVISSNSYSTLLMLTIIMVILLLGMGLLDWLRNLILIKISLKLGVILNDKTFNITFKNQLLNNKSQSNAKPMHDINGIRQFLTSNGMIAFFDAPWVPIYLSVMFLIHPVFGWIGFFASVIMIIFAFLNQYCTKELNSKANENNLFAVSYTTSSLRNAEVIEAMGMLTNIRKKWTLYSNKALLFQNKNSNRSTFFITLSKTTRFLLQSIILGAGALLVINQELTPGLMIGGSLLLGRALAPIDSLIGSWKQFINTRAQFERLKKILLETSDEIEKIALPKPLGKINVESLIVTPLGSQVPIIKGISFIVNPGEAIGIMGPSGAGKSTLARALLGIWPASNGKVRLDSADIFLMPQSEKNKYIGYLPQDVELFEGSIGDNISRFNTVDPVSLHKAAKIAGIHEIILRYPDGYDTSIGIGGNTLSGGQKQRIGLARAIYGDPKFIILDEPNSNLDESGELSLQKTLKYLKEQKSTVIIISHRKNIFQYVDKLLVLANGVITLGGGRDQVIAKLYPPPVKN